MTAALSAGRVGGLAVALGVGAGVLVGLAAQASAEPADTAGTAVRAGSGADGVSRAASARRSPAAGVAPAAAVGEVRRDSPQRDRAATRSSKSVGAALPFFPSDPRGRLITIYKGTHFAIPNSFGFFIREVSGTGTFTPNSAYDLKDEDQFDWNKFTGIAFTPLEPDRNSVMVGWRYNLASQDFEIAPFYNVDKARILPVPSEVISVPVGETFQYRVDYTGVTLIYGDRTVYKPFPVGLIPNVWTAARVSGWFGGNEVAPKTVSYYLLVS